LELCKTVVIIGGACLFLIACSEQSPVTTGQHEKSEVQATAQVETPEVEKPTDVNGTLTYTEKGLALVTKTNIYLVLGQDLSDLVGKKVKITGAIAEVDQNQAIQVMSVMPIE
jgi:hypothetical protein